MGKDGLCRLVGVVVGCILGVAVAWFVGWGFGQSVGVGFATLGGAIALGVVGYCVAASLRGNAGEAARALLVGINAGANATIWFAIGLWPLAVAVGAVNALAGSLTLSQSEIFQGVLGWGNWVLPMSWPIVSVGVSFLVVSALGHVVTAGKAGVCKLEGLGVDWATGTLSLRGGWVANINTYDTAFNMGNCAFVDRASAGDHVEHEAGHALNLAAFGSWFHLVGFVDEVVLGHGASAYAERLADSNTGAGGGNIPMWI